MKTLQSIYEEDKERLLSRISGADKETAVREIQRELDRLLMTFNDQETDDALREATSRMMQAARSAVGMMDTEGAAKIYGRTEYQNGKNNAPKRGKPPVRFWILLVAGILLAVWALGTAYSMMAQTNAGVIRQLTPGLGTVLAGLLIYAAGRSVKSAVPAQKEELHVETTVDQEKAAHQVLSIILTMDKNIEEFRTAQKIRKRQELKQASGSVDQAELELMAQLLEDAYGRREEDEQAEELRSQLKFYLHQKHIDVTDYEQGHGEWFDLIPAYSKGTIRPALVMEGVLLKKGLASNG